MVVNNKNFDEWIEIESEEELPKEDGLYLIAIKNNEGQYLGAFYNEGEWRTFAKPSGQIIAWSKPKPYEKNSGRRFELESTP